MTMKKRNLSAAFESYIDPRCLMLNEAAHDGWDAWRPDAMKRLWSGAAPE